MRKISKILSVFLAILMVVCALPVSASAQDVTLTISSDKSDVKAGDTVTVNVELSENSNINYFTIDLTYDNEKLQLLSATSQMQLSENSAKVINSTYSDNVVRMVVASVEKITEGNNILTVEFTVLSSYCSTISVNVIESANADFQEIPITTSPLEIHSFGDWKTVKEPTCETAGEKSKSCTCGEKISESINALGHDYATEYTVDSQANCTVNGSKSQHCSRCDSKQNTTVILATGHDYKEEITKVPTHTENGEKTFTCKNCNHAYTETIEADGTHKYISDVTKEPTCTEKGVLTYTCACGDTYTQEISMVAHTETTLSAVAPTCSQTGLTAGSKCSVCGDVITAQTTIPAKGHTEVTLSATAPTCTQTGLTEGAKCSDCGTVLDAQEEIPATGHSVNKDGYCDVCDEKLCDHNCHKSGISGFFWKIANFFNKLFGTKKYCECGIAHY